MVVSDRLHQNAGRAEQPLVLGLKIDRKAGQLPGVEETTHSSDTLRTHEVRPFKDTGQRSVSIDIFVVLHWSNSDEWIVFRNCGPGSVGREECAESQNLTVCDENSANRLSSPHVIRSAIPLSCCSRHGALARGASSPIRPRLEAGLGELSEPATHR